MNRKFLRAFSVVFALSALALSVSACQNDNSHNHEYGGWTVVREATCTEAGEKRRYCGCGDYQTEEIPPLGHVYEDLICSVCGRLSPDAPVTESLEYSEIEENGQTAGYLVTGAGENEVYIKIPSTYNGKPVTAIGESAFYNCTGLKSVSVGDGVTVIGELAFADCTALEGVTLGSSVKDIGGYAFSQCSSLKTVDFPASTDSIGECAFVSCTSLIKADFNDGLKSIGDCAFGGCTSLSEFVLPDSVKKIGWGVIMFTQGGEGWFEANDLTNKLTKVVMSDYLTEVPDFAFSKCNISTVEIGKRVATLRYSSFFGCGLLKSVVIPKSIIRIESYAFYQCPSLSTVFYAGTAEEWEKIKIGQNGNDISSAVKYFYSEDKPQGGGNFWHYADGVPAKWN